MSHLFANNATSRLKVITPAGSGTLTLLDGEGAKFPSPVAPDIFLVTIDDRRTGQIEICRCTARTGDILQVVRGQEGTVAQDFAEWATVSNRATAGTFQYLLDVVLNAAGWSKSEADTRFLNTIGDTATGPLKGVAPLDPEDLTRKDYVDARDATKAALVHTHPISDVTNLQAELDTKIEAGPLDGADYVQHLGVWTPFNWGTLDGKPATMPPGPHTHEMVEINNLDGTLAAMNAEITSKVGPEPPPGPTIYGRSNAAWVDVTQGLTWGQIPGQPETFPPSSHMHPIVEVLDLQATLNAKEPIIAPGSPTAFWAGDKTWKTIQQTAAAASIGDAPPSSPVPGQMWWESDTGYMFIRFQDANSQQWVQVNNPGIPDAPFDGQEYARKDGAWVGVTGGGGGSGGIGEAPTDGQVYNRRGSTASWVVATSLDWGNITGKPATFPPTLPIPQSGITNLVADLAAKEPTIAAGTSAQYWRGTKSWATLDKAAVGLGSVDNTSDANKPISSATQTALNAKEPSLPGGGTTSTFLRGDKTWAVPGGGGGVGDVTGPAGSTDNAVARFNAATGKFLKNSTFLIEDDGKFKAMSGANAVMEYGTTGTSSSGGLIVRAMPPHGQTFYITPRSDTDGGTHLSGYITVDGPLFLPANPSAANEAARKAYVDTKEPALPAGGNATNFLRGDKTWAVPAGGGGTSLPIDYEQEAGQTVPSINLTDGGFVGQTQIRATNYLGQYIDICNSAVMIDTTGDAYFGGTTTLTNAMVDLISQRGAWPTSEEPPNLVLDGTTLQLSVSTVVTPKITVGTAAPSSPAEGDLWVDTN